ncbi:unnamed protein product [Urochloa humidicola]
MLGIDTSQISVTQLWNIERPTNIPLKHFTSYIILICWHLWKHRNAVVFNAATPSHLQMWANCKEDARLWSFRWPITDREIADSWCSSFHIM